MNPFLFQSFIETLDSSDSHHLNQPSRITNIHPKSNHWYSNILFNYDDTRFRRTLLRPLQQTDLFNINPFLIFAKILDLNTYFIDHVIYIFVEMWYLALYYQSRPYKTNETNFKTLTLYYQSRPYKTNDTNPKTPASISTKSKAKKR